MIGYVAMGGALGSVVRYLLAGAVGSLSGVGFPYGTLAVNLLGGLAMGALVGLLARIDAALAPQLRALLAIGFLGGFTTFSAFSLDAVTLMERGEYGAMAVYIAFSVLGSILALMAGLGMVRAWA